MTASTAIGSRRIGSRRIGSRRIGSHRLRHASERQPGLRAVLGGLSAAVGVLFGLDWPELWRDP